MRVCWSKLLHVANLRFELGVESSATQTELVLVVLRILNRFY